MKNNPIRKEKFGACIIRNRNILITNISIYIQNNLYIQNNVLGQMLIFDSEDIEEVNSFFLLKLAFCNKGTSN